MIRKLIPVTILLLMFLLGDPVFGQVQKIILGNVSKPPKPPTRTLTVTFSGNGWGWVIISGSIKFAFESSYDFLEGTVLTLTAEPHESSYFMGWSGGGCSGTEACIITLNEDTVVNADFWSPPI